MYAIIQLRVVLSKSLKVNICLYKNRTIMSHMKYLNKKVQANYKLAYSIQTFRQVRRE
jgi:hypothetical protein